MPYPRIHHRYQIDLSSYSREDREDRLSAIKRYDGSVAIGANGTYEVLWSSDRKIEDVARISSSLVTVLNTYSTD